MAFIEPMQRNKPNVTYLLKYLGPGIINILIQPIWHFIGYSTFQMPKGAD